MRRLKANISEIFESIQGEGILIGVRQLFVRFAECNLNCIYCDTPKNSDFCMDYISNVKLTNPVSLEHVLRVLRSVKVHSVSWTGGEPLLYAEFIRSVEKVQPFYLETNMTLPEKAKIVRDVVDYVAGDFKVSSALPSFDYDEIFERTVKCFKILRNTRRRLTFCKFVLPEKFDEEEIVESANAVKDYVKCFVLQPVFGRENVKALMNLQRRLMDIGDVRIVPQVHKYLGVR
jgi:organic radical activating enzyme